LIENLKDKYAWQPLFSLTAKPLTMKYFEDAVRAYIDGNTNLDEEMQSLQQSRKDRIKKLTKTLKEINAPKTLQSYVELLQGYMYLRTYRKNVIAKAHYLHLPLLMEIGNRMGIGEDIKLISYEEMVNYLRNGDTVGQSVIRERRSAWAVLAIDGKISIISGEESVKAISQKYKIEDVQKQGSIKMVKGQPACLGKATGKVKIIKNIREFEKINQGDILIAPMTTPDYVPIMKKVSAIVTDEGGATCHAAIVSREFNIPCIVGAGNATKVFTDGDFIEVNADLGIAKMI
jgi:pyruvate,water dikinase